MIADVTGLLDAAAGAQWLQHLLILALASIAAIMLISGIDDALYDAWFWIRALRRAIFKRHRMKPVSREALLGRAEEPMAVMIPAWEEAAVLEPMLARLSRTIDYTNYRAYVGVYPNDAATQLAARRAAALNPRLRIVTLDHDGPTNKADCLNGIWSAVLADEASGCKPYEIFVMHDCEDVIHPLAWRLFNWLIPRKDMVQLPVLSLPRSGWDWTAGHYQDEFAQQHLKDLVVRESMHRSLPAAGVGVAFSRRAMNALADGERDGPFGVGSLTEDYDLGMRLRGLGMTQIFARFWVEGELHQPHPSSGDLRPTRHRELICVREYFPATLSASVRQKARWIVGIALQGWRTWGWRGDWVTRYMLLRDRKVLVTSLAVAAGYLVSGVFVALWLWQSISIGGHAAIPDAASSDWLTGLLLANLVILALRIVQRMAFTGWVYGPAQAMLSLPRMVWASWVNFLATSRALRLWARHLRTGEPIGWDKTAHEYPQETEPAPALNPAAVVRNQTPDHPSATEALRP